MELSGRTALVTGGGRGIGAAIAASLAADGATIVVVARSQDEIEAVALEITSVGGTAWAVAGDMTVAEDVDSVIDRAVSRAGPIDILVNNAGAAVAAPLAKTSLDDWNRMFAVNATSTFLCTRALAPAMAERGWGRVVNVASVASRAGAKYIAAYAAAKHAVLGFTRSVALELAGSGVTVNALCPGYVDTDMTARSIERIVAETGRSRAESRRALEATSPQDRLIQPDEVAAATMWLCTESARGVNGQAIVIDGGGLVA